MRKYELSNRSLQNKISLYLTLHVDTVVSMNSSTSNNTCACCVVLKDSFFILFVALENNLTEIV